ncbi:SLC13 family permease [soil metagenome]
MTTEIVLVLLILFGAIVLFSTEWLPIDLVALLILVSLVLTGIITAEEGVAGFSNNATVTVAAMFVLSAGLSKTGVVTLIGSRLALLYKRNFLLGITFTMVAVAFVSAFINNTPVVAIFIPLVIRAAAVSKHSASKMLMPISFASMFGGVCTLIGTSTNILVSGVAVQHGQPAFGMFEMAPMGLVFFAVGILYMVLVGVRLIPERQSEVELTQKFGMGDYLTEVVLLPESSSAGKRLAESPLVRDLDLDIIEIQREGQVYSMPSPSTVLLPNDLLRVRCNVERLKELKEKEGVAFKTDNWKDRNYRSENLTLVEVVIAPNSELEGKTLKAVGFRHKYGATAIAIRHRGLTMHENLTNTVLGAGDTLLLEVRKDQLTYLKQAEMKQGSPFLLVSAVGLPEYRRDKTLPAVVIIAAVVVLATFDILPIMTGALAGSILMVLTRCLTMREFYEAIDWKVIFLLAGALSLGIALQKSGAAALLSGFLIDVIGNLGPVAVVSALYLVTTLLTEGMSNNATAVLLAPIAIASAQAMGVDPRPFLMAITFAASASFMTPVGYQTNTMIYGAGQYKFGDFTRVGAPLNLIFWILATLLIPYFFPF